jgi:hypothetical protein
MLWCKWSKEDGKLTSKWVSEPDKPRTRYDDLTDDELRELINELSIMLLERMRDGH